MERHGVWPTPLNYELGLHCVADPAGPLACAVQELVEQGDLHSDDFSEKLARRFLPRLRFEEELGDAGGALVRQLDRVGRVLDDTRASNAEVVDSMVAAENGLSGAGDLDEARTHLHAAADAIRTAQSRAAGFEAQLDASAADVNQLRLQLDRIRRDALTDPLTSLSNRRAFEQDVEMACAESDTSGVPLSLAMIDIDRFKQFNDAWGHQTGDQVIRFMGSLLNAFAMPPRMASRYGGEEFAVIMPREDERSAARALEALRLEVAGRSLRRRTTGDDLGQVTVSIGVAQRARDEPIAVFVERADAALYASKHTGRDRVTLASDSRVLPDPLRQDTSASH